MNIEKPVIAVLGGTGKEGFGLAYRWASAGYPVILGSRVAEKASAAADELRKRVGPGGTVSDAANRAAAQGAAIVVLAVPYAAQLATALAVDERCGGVRFVIFEGPSKADKTLSHLMQGPHWSLLLDFEPGAPKQSWNMLRSPGLNAFTKGAGNPTSRR